MSLMFWNILALLAVAILASTTTGKKNRHSKTNTIFYGIIIVVLIIMMVASAGYRVGSDMAKRDNRNDSIITEPVPPK